MLTNLSTNIVSVDAGGTFCTLTDDIFNNGDGYQVRDAPFNYNHPLTNIEVIKRFIGGLPNSVIKLYALSATSNFYAGLTTDVVETTFPATISPVAYDDDSTPPFYDDGGNYDNINFEYTIPSSGLYGFEANAILRVNGQIGSNEILNGDFSTSAYWILSYGGFYGSIYSGAYHLDVGGSNTSNVYLKQLAVFTSFVRYKLTFDVDIIDGSVVVDGNVFSTSGTHSVIIDYSQNSNPPNELKFTFSKWK